MIKEFIVTDEASLYELAVHILRNTKIEKLVINQYFQFYDLIMRLGLNVLRNITVLNIDTIDCSKTYRLDGLFSNMTSLQTIPELINTEQINGVKNMFRGCEKLITVNKFDTQNVLDFSGMFTKCKSIRYVPDFNTQSALDMSYMFYDCQSLEVAPNLDTSKVINFKRMFADCTSLRFIPSFNLEKAEIVGEMLCGCKRLKQYPDFEIKKEQVIKFLFKKQI